MKNRGEREYKKADYKEKRAGMGSRKERGKEREAVKVKTVMRLLIAAAVMLSLTVIPVYADVIWTPMDSFLEQNWDKCENVSRKFYANGPKGYVTVYTEPKSWMILDHAANGCVFFVSQVYMDGPSESWGVVQYCKDENGRILSDSTWYDGEEIIGWIPMSQMEAVYDEQSFREDHEDEIQKADRETFTEEEIDKILELGKVIRWEYPGKAQEGSEYPVSDRNTVKEWRIIDIYNAPDGSLWGYVNGKFGSPFKNIDIWVNLSDPAAKGEIEKAGELEEAGDLKESRIPPISQEELEKLPRTGPSDITLTVTVGAMILLVIVGTIVVIRRISKDQKTIN